MRHRAELLPVMCFLVTVLATVIAVAQEPVRPVSEPTSTFTNPFEETLPWRIDIPASSTVQVQPALFPSDRDGAGQTAVLQILGDALTPDLRASHPLPPAIRFNDVTASVWVRSTCPNVRLLLRLVFPLQVDPRTGQPLEADLLGDRYTTPDQWQRLTCSASDQAFESLLIRIRAQLADASTFQSLDTREVFISQAVLLFDALPGETYLATDDLQLSPVVNPSGTALQALPKQVQKPRLHFGNDRILLDGKPFFPLFTTYHGEPLETIQQSAVNMLWIENYQDQALLQALESRGLGILAQPPRISRDTEQIEQHRLPVLDSSTAPIWAWMLGKQIPEQELTYLSKWATALRDADHQMPRPVFAEVQGLERQFHRYVSMLGASEVTIHSAINPLEAANRLEARQDAALPGKPMFTFIPTEPADARIEATPDGASLPILEPEQILQQGYAALTAGYRGIGFTKRIPFDQPATGLQERLLAIRLFNLRVKVLEPWLATGRLAYHLETRVGNEDWNVREKTASRIPFASRWDTVVVKGEAPHSSSSALAGKSKSSVPIRASMFQTDYGYLILLSAFEPGSQFVPGSVQAENVRFLIVGDAIQGWEITPTEVSTSNLEMTHEAGGTAIHLKKFDQFAAVLITRDASVIDSLRKRLGETRHSSAETLVQLAELKLARVADVHQQLIDLRAPAIPDGQRFLMAAEQMLARARQELADGHDSDAWSSAQMATGFLRRLQRLHWDKAQSSLSSPMSSPYLCSFQTLPDHWKLLAKVGRNAVSSENLLSSGDFENHAELETSWGYEASPRAEAAGMTTRVELLPTESQPGHALSLTLLPPATNYLPRPQDVPWAMVSPEMACRAGEVLYISGKVRIPRGLDPVAGGFAVYDTLLGPTAAVRLSSATSDWERFTLLREVPQDGVIRLHFELNSPGTVLLDDVQVKALSPVE